MENLRMLGNAFLNSQLLIEEIMRDSMERIMEGRRIAEVCGLDVSAMDRVIQESSLEAKEKYESEIKNMADALAVLAEREQK